MQSRKGLQGRQQAGYASPPGTLKFPIELVKRHATEHELDVINSALERSCP